MASRELGSYVIIVSIGRGSRHRLRYWTARRKAEKSREQDLHLPAQWRSKKISVTCRDSHIIVACENTEHKRAIREALNLHDRTHLHQEPLEQNAYLNQRDRIMRCCFDELLMLCGFAKVWSKPSQSNSFKNAAFAGYRLEHQ